MTHAATHRYKTTESKYKAAAKEMYITYDLWQATRGDRQALYPKVKRVYMAGHVTAWQVGTFAKRTGKHVHGVKIEYEQSRASYARQGYMATRGNTRYHVPPTHVRKSAARFAQIVEVPEAAQNMQFHAGTLPGAIPRRAPGGALGVLFRLSRTGCQGLLPLISGTMERMAWLSFMKFERGVW